MRKIIFILFVFLLSSCKSDSASPQPVEDKFFDAEHAAFKYSGRTLNSSGGEKLITSAASVRTNVYGDTVTVFLKSDNSRHHYVAVELNDEYQGRFRITKDTLKFALPHRDSINSLAVYKETEASNGALIFSGLRAQNIEKPAKEKRAKIEFIGDSITCGMGADSSDINCEEGEWYDQHNVYMAYGPRVARILDVDFEVNCVSGMGIYRNWNDEDQPVMPEVYPYLHLNGEQGKRAEIKKEDAPNVVSIALGTNDFSLGDGQKTRFPFKSEEFKKNYKSFIESLFDIYPDTRVALLSSPMTGKEDGEELVQILKEIQKELANHPIEIFEFREMNLHGCSAHPSIEDHKLMAERLVPFYRNLLKK